MQPFDQETTRSPLRHHGGAPRPEERPFLLGISGEHAGRLFPLEGLREIYIGRTADCEIACLLDGLISRRHAHVTVDDAGRAWIEDLDSMNGTLVNGVSVSRPTMLRRGDRVYLGESCIFKLDWLTDEEVARWQSATIDALTDCLNRGSFQTRIDDLFTLSRTRPIPVGLLLLDVDHFKAINDDHGHQVGDYVLQRIAASAKAVLAEIAGDVPAYRYGGEEFAVLLPEASMEQARAIAEAIRHRIEATVLSYQDLRIKVTISGGVAHVVPKDSDQPSALVRAADEKLYRAKRDGRNRIVA
jgi:diguanylate cyclase (GGDEF)-like protein